MLSTFGPAVGAAATVLLLAGVVLSAPYARWSGTYLKEWWTPLALAALACMAGFSLDLFAGVAGTVLMAGAGIAALVTVALANPPLEPGS
jgi:hypothetical protein